MRRCRPVHTTIATLRIAPGDKSADIVDKDGLRCRRRNNESKLLASGDGLIQWTFFPGRLTTFTAADPSTTQLLLDREALRVIDAALTFAGKFHPSCKTLSDQIDRELARALSDREGVQT